MQKIAKAGADRHSSPSFTPRSPHLEGQQRRRDQLQRQLQRARHLKRGDRERGEVNGSQPCGTGQAQRGSAELSGAEPITHHPAHTREYPTK